MYQTGEISKGAACEFSGLSLGCGNDFYITPIQWSIQEPVGTETKVDVGGLNKPAMLMFMILFSLVSGDYKNVRWRGTPQRLFEARPDRILRAATASRKSDPPGSMLIPGGYIIPVFPNTPQIAGQRPTFGVLRG